MRSRSPGEQRALVAAGAGADFQEQAAAVIGIARQQQQLQRAFQFLDLAPAGLDLFLGHGLHVGIGQHLLRGGEIFLAAHEGIEGLDHGLQLGALALAEAVHVGRGVRFGKHGVDLDEAMAQMLQPAAHG